jgi:hypothetical protein
MYLTGPEAWDDYVPLLAVESCMGFFVSAQKSQLGVPSARNCTGKARFPVHQLVHQPARYDPEHPETLRETKRLI